MILASILLIYLPLLRNFKMYLFIFDCAFVALWAFLELWLAGAALCCCRWASRCGGFPRLEHRLGHCDSWASLIRSRCPRLWARARPLWLVGFTDPQPVPQAQRAGSATVTHGLHCSAAGAPGSAHRLGHCDSWARLLCSMWELPRPGIEPMSPALAGWFFITEPPGKPCWTLYFFTQF